MRVDLTRDCLPDILRSIYLNRRSGSLRLIQEQTRKEIFFELGAMIFASSNRKEDRIGETMVRHGTLSREDFQLVQSHMGRGKRFGKVLIELGLVSERDLITNVTFQVLDTIYSVFNWTTGTYEFIEVEKSVSDDLKLELSTASIILEGVRRINDTEVIQRGLGDLNRLIGPSTNPLLRLQTLSLKPLERQIIEMTRKPVGLLHILVTAKSPAESVLRSLYGLLSAGVLERFAPPEISRESGKFVVPEAVRQALEQDEPPAPIVITRRTTGSHKFLDDMVLRDRIYTIKELIAQGDPYKLIGVSPDVSREELHDAYYKLAREFHPDQHQQASKDLRTDVDEIFAEITRSYEEIRSQMQSVAAAAAIASMRSTAISEPLTDTSQLIESVQTIADRLQPETDFLIEPVEKQRPEPTIISVAKDLPVEKAPVVKKPTTGGLKPPPTPQPPTKAEPPGPTADQQRAEQLFIDGRNRFQAKDLTGAARLLREATRLDPAQPRYRLLLGHVLCNNQRWHKEAEDQFRRVLEIDPFNAMAHVGLGQLYAKVGLNRRAEMEFRKALKLDPENSVAQKWLYSLKNDNSPEGPSPSFLSKIFTKK